MIVRFRWSVQCFNGFDRSEKGETLKAGCDSTCLVYVGLICECQAETFVPHSSYSVSSHSFSSTSTYSTWHHLAARPTQKGKSDKRPRSPLELHILLLPRAKILGWRYLEMAEVIVALKTFDFADVICLPLSAACQLINCALHTVVLNPCAGL